MVTSLLLCTHVKVRVLLVPNNGIVPILSTDNSFMNELEEVLNEMRMAIKTCAKLKGEVKNNVKNIFFLYLLIIMIHHHPISSYLILFGNILFLDFNKIH